MMLALQFVSKSWLISNSILKQHISYVYIDMFLTFQVSISEIVCLLCVLVKQINYDVFQVPISWGCLLGAIGVSIWPFTNVEKFFLIKTLNSMELFISICERSGKLKAPAAQFLWTLCLMFNIYVCTIWCLNIVPNLTLWMFITYTFYTLTRIHMLEEKVTLLIQKKWFNNLKVSILKT